MLRQRRNKILILLAVAVTVLPACRKSGSKSSANGAAATGPAAPAQNPVAANPPVTSDTASTSARPTIRRAPRSARNDELWNLGQSATRDFRQVCTRGPGGRLLQAASVTHYYISPQAKVGDLRCKNGFGYYGQPAMSGTCMHPCRTLAADPRFYRPGEILYFPALVGLTCGSGKNKMVHDGFMVVMDNGNPEAINSEGRFGAFWGRCQAENNGFCLDQGAVALDFALTFSNYCRAWRPQDPTWNSDIKLLLYNQVRKEAIRRGDRLAAEFDLDDLIGLGVDQNGFIYRHSAN